MLNTISSQFSFSRQIFSLLFFPQVTAALLIFCGSIMFSAKLIKGQCNYNQNLIPGTTYYIYNPNYPYSYRGSESCVWTVTSDYRVNLTCTDFQLPWVRLEKFFVRLNI